MFGATVMILPPLASSVDPRKGVLATGVEGYRRAFQAGSKNVDFLLLEFIVGVVLPQRGQVGAVVMISVQECTHSGSVLYRFSATLVSSSTRLPY